MVEAIASISNARLLRLTGLASVATAMLLILAKTAAWMLTDSIALLASLVDSMMDSAASLINLLAIRYALIPPDDEHRFGHGKAEALAGLGQAMFIAGSSVFLVLQAIERLLRPKPLDDAGIGIAVMVFSIAVTLALITLQRYTIRRTGSTAVRADSLHYVSDLAVNLSIILALLAATAGFPALDAWAGIAIAGYILYSAWHIARDAFHHLLDREVDGAVREAILDLAHQPEEVRGVHDLRTRQSGQQMFVQIHLEMSRDLPLWQAHRAAEWVETAVRKRFPGSDVIAHQDPWPMLPSDEELSVSLPDLHHRG